LVGQGGEMGMYPVKKELCQKKQKKHSNFSQTEEHNKKETGSTSQYEMMVVVTQTKGTFRTLFAFSENSKVCYPKQKYAPFPLKKHG